MTRQGALRAEVFLRLDDADAEELRPQAVHRDAGGERVVAADQPFRQAESIRRRALWKSVKRHRHSGFNPLAGVEEIAFVQKMRFTPLVGGQFAHHRQRHRLDVVKFPPQLVQTFVDSDNRRREFAEPRCSRRQRS